MMRKYWKEALSFAAAMMSFLSFADAEAEKAARRFATGGEVTSFRYEDATGIGWTAFLHTFTNTAEAAEFHNTSGKTLPVRLLAVGGGGAGRDGSNAKKGSSWYGVGGGGGGGVKEMDDVSLAADAVWSIHVGAGGSSSGVNITDSGATSVSNGVADVATVLGGGAGGRWASYARSGAAGGGGSVKSGDGTSKNGAIGEYPSSIRGEIPSGAPFKGADGNPALGSDNGWGGGGGGAGSAGNGKTGGAGLASDITGESVIYGAGGGGGGYYDYTYTRYGTGGDGGDGTGNGGKGELVITDGGATTNVTLVAATEPAPNRGGGGGGGVCFRGEVDGSSANVYGTSGADGVVIIRYDIPDTPCVGGDVVTVTTNGNRVIYIHKFTNTTVAATFTPSVVFDGTSVRLLAVGGGGAGRDGTDAKKGSNIYGVGGGGGGGVTEIDDVPLTDGEVWTIRIGAGGSSSGNDIFSSGATSVSNEAAVAEVVSVQGGGAGGRWASSYAQDGAAGGGGSGKSGDALSKTGADGTYRSSIRGVYAGEKGFEGGDANMGSGNDNGWGGGGGGAGSAGNGKTGGAGLASDITGESVIYGAGGGGGGYYDYTYTMYGTGGNGGDGAGNGGKGELVITSGGATTNVTLTAATPPASNRGGGGGGGVCFRGETNGSSDKVSGTAGADGVVIIRYEVKMPKGFMIIFK